MVVLLIGIVVLYVFLVYSCARAFLREREEEKEKRIFDLKERVAKLEEKKDQLYKEKLNLQTEAVNIFTLYEITKDITKALNKKEAFGIFKDKLAEHVKFNECRLVEPGDISIQRLKRDDDYFLFMLKTKEKKAGYLVVKGISDEEKEIVVILATQFSLALRRVELYQEIERIAITDSLTEVSTRRYTLDRLNEEINRSKAQKLDLAILMIDVDHFKKINDSYGHLTGDQVLREIARIIKENLREIDIAGRYGGEEFCVVLPDTDSDGAQFAGERIRQATQDADIKAYDTQINATVSIGISQYPKDGSKSSELIDKADWALYRAKKKGRNCVCSFGVYKDN